MMGCLHQNVNILAKIFWKSHSLNSTTLIICKNWTTSYSARQAVGMTLTRFPDLSLLSYYNFAPSSFIRYLLFEVSKIHLNFGLIPKYFIFSHQDSRWPLTYQVFFILFCFFDIFRYFAFKLHYQLTLSTTQNWFFPQKLSSITGHTTATVSSEK